MLCLQGDNPDPASPGEFWRCVAPYSKIWCGDTEPSNETVTVSGAKPWNMETERGQFDRQDNRKYCIVNKVHVVFIIFLIIYEHSNVDFVMI